MIVYFSGTGNSRHAARRLAELLEDKQLIDAGELIRHGEAPAFESETPYIFVCPTYAWRIPRVFEAFLRAARFEGNSRAYFVMTCGDGVGGAQRFVTALCAEKGWQFMGLAQIVMPENYIALFEAPDTEEAGRIIDAAEPKVAEAIEHIRADRPFPAAAVSVMDRMLTAVANPVFYRTIVKADAFRATEACTGCGKCERACALNNIRITEGKPAWGKECTHCMACICGCPAHAIEYGKRSIGKVRYQCPR